MPERMQATIPVFLYVLDGQNRVYLQRRSNTGYMDGFWEPPAGKTDDGEFPPDAACREGREEAGIYVDKHDLELFHTYANLTDGKPWIGFKFRTRRWQGEPAIREPDKCDAAGFYALNELPKVTPQVWGGLMRLMSAAAIEMSLYTDIR